MFAALFFLNIVKGLRMPSQWAMTHYLFTYQTGFIKRALWGELLRRVLGGWTASYFCLAAVGLAVLAALVALLWHVCQRLPVTADTVRFLLVFGASPALAYVVHLAGYLEEIAYLAILVGFLLRRRSRLQLAWWFLAAAVLPLVHEASVLWVGCLSGLAVATAQEPPSRRLAALVLLAVVWAASTTAVLRFGRVTRPQLDAIRTDRVRMAQFHMREDAFNTLRTPLSEQAQGMKMWWSNPDRQFEFATSVLAFGPALYLLAAIAIRGGRAMDAGPALQATAVTLVLGAIATPLLLHAIAIDQHRWNALATFNAGLAALIVLRSTPAAVTRPPAARGLALALVVCLWSISAHPFFLDEYAPAHPPFAQRLWFLINAVQRPSWDLWIPRD